MFCAESRMWIDNRRSYKSQVFARSFRGRDWFGTAKISPTKRTASKRDTNTSAFTLVLTHHKPGQFSQRSPCPTTSSLLCFPSPNCHLDGIWSPFVLRQDFHLSTPHLETQHQHQASESDLYSQHGYTCAHSTTVERAAIVFCLEIESLEFLDQIQERICSD